MNCKLTIFVAALALTPSMASASWVENRTQWRGLSAEQKSGYAMGALDIMMMPFANDKVQSAGAIGRFDCVRALELNSDDITKIITDAYERDTTYWGNTAGGVLYTETHRMCKSYINTNRVKMGLPPLP